MKKIIILINFLILLSSFGSVKAFADDEFAALDSKTKILNIPHAKVLGSQYSLVFKMDDSVMPSTFTLKEAKQDNTFVPGGDSGYQTYYTKSDLTLTIPKVQLDGKSFYQLDLKGLLIPNVGDKLTMGRFADDLPSYLFFTSFTKTTFKASGVYGKDKVGPHFIVTGNPAVTIFSDRPYRIANDFQGGLKGFAQMYQDSDFVDNPPNATFKGVNTKKQTITTVVEFGRPIISGANIILPITSFIGEEPVLPYGIYTNVSMVIDSWWNPADWFDWGAAAKAAQDAIESAARAAAELAAQAVEAAKNAKDVVINALPIPDQYKEWVKRSMTAYSCSSIFGFATNYNECIDTAKNIYYDASGLAHQL